MLAPGELPLRPMTLGELLDAAMTLLRRRAVPLLGASAVLAVLEQLFLAPLRGMAYVTPPYYGPAEEHIGTWWLVVAVGFGSEAFVLTVLGALAAAAAVPAVLGRQVRDRELWRRLRPLLTISLGVLLGLLGAVAAFLGLLPFLVVWGFLGMSAAAAVIDRAVVPFARSAQLASRAGMRAFWILAAAYLSWFAVRFALGAGWSQLAGLFTGAEPATEWWLGPLAWTLANTVAYAALACVGAVVLIEVRVRTEGLDIAIGRARAHGTDDAAPLVQVP